MKKRSFTLIIWSLWVVAMIFGQLPCVAQNLTKGPYLVAPGSTEMIIRWESDTLSDYTLNYGQERVLSDTKRANLRGIKGDGYLYEVVIEDLKPGVQYDYQVSWDNRHTTMSSFTTFREKQSRLHFVAMGDSRSNPDIFASIMNSVDRDEPEFMISMGDLVAIGGNLAEWQTYYFDVTKNVTNHIPLVSTLGDHEGENDNGELFRHFMRTDQPTEKQWFSFDYGDAHFISLDYRYPDSKEMARWFKRDISSSDARWKFVYMHRPAYNLGGHRSTWGRGKWPELFSKYHVDIVFAGHSHVYERFFPMRQQHVPDSWPVTYITTGGAGAGLYEVMQNASLAVAESVNHYVDVVISGDTLRLTAIRNDSSLLDELTIVKQGAGYTPAYNALVQSQESVNLLTDLATSISVALKYVPLEWHMAPHVLTLRSSANEEIPFLLELTENAARAYRMNAFAGVLKAHGVTQVPLEIFSNTDSITISGWGSINPELRFKLIYTYDSVEETILSGRIRYRPSFR